MTSIQVVHVKRSPGCFRVDRGTPLGNPFILEREADRAEVCRAHKEYLWAMIRTSGRVLALEPARAARLVLKEHPRLKLAPSWQWSPPRRDDFMEALQALQNAAIAATPDRPLAIGCHCAPNPCHGDNYKAWLEWDAELDGLTSPTGEGFVNV